MSKKTRSAGLILLTVIVILLFLVGPAATLLTRLGIDPICIQGQFPRIRIVRCPEPISGWDAVPSPPAAAPTPRPDAVPLIVDDDGSIDGLIALLYFLSDPAFEVVAVTVSYGEAHPAVYAPQMLGFLARLGHSHIPVGAGSETPLQGTLQSANSFPDSWRAASDDFWGFAPPETVTASQPLPAAQLMVDVIHASPDPVMVFVSGAHTNLAEALRLDPAITGNILGVHVMGGAVYRQGNIHSDWPEIDNTAAEWNIWVDPQAASEVFAAGLPLHLTPLDATDQVAWTRADVESWQLGQAEGILAGEMLRWMLDNWNPDGATVWDLVAALHAADPALCPETPLALTVSAAPGPQQGQTALTQGAPNVLVCLAPDLEKMKARAALVFGE